MIALFLKYSVNNGKPSNEELVQMSYNIAKHWKPIRRRLKIDCGTKAGRFDWENEECSEKAYKCW